ncbi:TonB-dependent receptor [Terasakiella sp.]|uniref:TonB-dependent receptor n=1 Tax=Terasakiella sp. TaxID=2034861 RepID=UPI003AA9E0FB
MSVKINLKMHRSVWAMATCAIALGSAQGYAQSPYVDTTKMKSHVHMGPPPIITAPNHIMGRAEHQFKQGTVENTPGAADKVATAKKTAKISLGYDGGIKTGSAQAAQRGGSGFVMGSLRRDDAGNYEDRNGNDLHFGYERTLGQVVLGLTPNATTELKFIGVMDHIDDDKQPHHAMDPHKTERHIGKAFLTFKDVGGFEELQTYFSAIDVMRRADNYTVRDATGARLRVETDRRMYEGGASGRFETNGFTNAVGFSLKKDDHEATRYNVTLGDVINSYRFPDVEQTVASLWGDSETNLGDTTRAKFGLRYDYRNAEATKADITPTGNPAPFNISAMSLYRMYYGATDAKVTDHNISAKMKLEQDIDLSNGMLFGEAGRMVRSPDNKERWHALSGPSANRWIGNPDLNPEKHHKAEIGVEFKGDGYKDYQRSTGQGSAWKTSFSTYYDKVSDFITYDKARGQSGVLLADNATISRNVDATLIGAKAEVQWNVNTNLATRLVATYTYGDNDSDNRPLYQVRPFETYWLVDYTDDLDVIGTWNVGSKLRFSGRQSRLDDDATTGLGMDTDGTSGAFATLDLYGGVQLYNQVGLSLGVDNVFDKEYNEHITGEHIANTARAAVDAPGRTFYVRAVANF